MHAADEKGISSVRDSIWGFFVNNWRVTLLFLILFVFGGLASLITLPLESDPEVKIPIALVSTTYPGASPADMEKLVTDRIEEKLKNLIRCHLQEFQNDKNMAIIFQSEVRYLRDIESQIKDISKMYLDLLSDIIEQGQIEGTMRQDLFVGLVKRFILGAVEGVISTWVSADGRYDLVSMADPLVDLYLTGVRGE